MTHTGKPLIGIAFIWSRLLLAPADWCLMAAKSYATIHLNIKSSKSLGWSHRFSTKFSFVKGSLGSVYFGWASSVCFPPNLKVPGSRLSRPLFTQRNQARTESTLCGGGGRLANFMGVTSWFWQSLPLSAGVSLSQNMVCLFRLVYIFWVQETIDKSFR